MKKFLIRILWFFIGFGLVNFGIGVAYHLLSGKSRLASTVLKEQRLQETRGEPRVVLIGGSATAYGINSELISRATDREVVNMGVQASLGLRFMLRQAEDELSSNDIVVLNMEPALLGTLPVEGEATMLEFFMVRPSAVPDYWDWAYVPLFVERYAVLLKTVMRGAVGSLKNLVRDRDFYSDQVNEYGDYTGHKGKKASWEGAPEALGCFEVRKDNLETLSAFKDFLEERDIPVYINWAPIASSRLSSECQEKFRRHTDFEELPVISEFDNSLLPDSLFYDTAHHLKYRYRDDFSARLAEFLRELE